MKLNRNNCDDVIRAAFLIPGWCYLHELEYIYRLTKQSKKHLEIGTFSGKSLFVAGCAMDNGSEILCVDPMDFTYVQDIDPYFRIPYDNSGGIKSWIEDIFDLTVKALATIVPDTKITLVKETSVKAATQYDGGFFDTMYIDGVHIKQFVEMDIESWWPYLKPNGTMLGHDYSGQHIGVVEAVNDLFGPSSQYGSYETIHNTRFWQHIKPNHPGPASTT